MVNERDGSNSEEAGKHSHIPLIAIEGVGGSGKSHVIQEIDKLFTDGELMVLTAKVSGLGDSERVRRLREINDYRECQIQIGQASPKILADKQRDRLFRLATKYQIRLLLDELEKNGSDIGILDRTPIMPWVYASAVDCNNPYLDEILRDGILQTISLGISTIYFLSVSPETAYSRIIARACVQNVDDFEQRALELCEYISAGRESTVKIVEAASNLARNNHSLKPKEYRMWDFIPYKVMVGECERYNEVLDKLRNEHGIRFVKINAEKSVEQIVSDISHDVKSHILQNL